MKKSLIVFFLSVVALFTLCFTTAKVSADEVTEAGKVVFHYQLWNKDYSSSGLWTWDTGTGGTSAPVTSTVTDSFGAVYEITVMSNAADKIGIIPLRKDINSDDRWKSREVADGDHIQFDVTPLKNGTVEELHIYYFQGGYQKYYVTDPTKANVIVLYYEPTGSYESKLGVWAWDGWTNFTPSTTWAEPNKIFENGFKSPGNVQGKTALMQFAEGSDPGFLIYAGSDDTKKCGDVKTFKDMKAGDVRVVYVSGKTIYDGVEKVDDFIANAFSFGFIDFNIDELSGTFAKSPTVIFSKFTIAVPTKEVTGKETIVVNEVVGQKAVVEDSDDGWKLPTDLPTYTQYTPTPVPANLKGKVVFHYQRWGGDYYNSGLWTWGVGDEGTKDAVIMNGVDNFGAVMEIMIDDNNAADTIGIVPLAKDADKDTRWDSRETPDGQHINLDITSIKNGTTTEIHVYYFQGGHNTCFVADSTKGNVFVVYFDRTGTYEDTLGVHAWGSWANLADSAWGTPSDVFVDGFKSPSGIQGKVALMQVTPGSNPGMLVYAGDDATKKHQGDIGGFDTMAAGDVAFKYVTVGQKFDARLDFAPVAFGGKIVWVDVYGDVEYEIDVYSPIDMLPFFTLKQGTTIIPIKQLDYNKTADTTNEFVIQLENANKLDITKEYTLYFNNGKEGDANLSDEIVLDLDTKAPTIELDDNNTRIEVKLGEKWVDSKWPIYIVKDNRDGSISYAEVYVKENGGLLNTNQAGEYPITLQVKDEWGNIGELTFKIYVVAPEAKGCGAKTNNIIISFGLLGLVFLFRRRRFI